MKYVIIATRSEESELGFAEAKCKDPENEGPYLFDNEELAKETAARWNRYSKSSNVSYRVEEYIEMETT